MGRGNILKPPIGWEPLFKTNTVTTSIPSTMVKKTTFKLDEKYVSLTPLDELSIQTIIGAYKGDTKSDDRIEVGDICSFDKGIVEGVDLGKLYFRVYKIINEYNDVQLNSLIVREAEIDADGHAIENVNPTNRRKFSISPSMCKQLGIPYTEGLELWPISNSFKPYNITAKKKQNKAVDYADLSTYPTHVNDYSIRRIAVTLNGFKPFNSTHIITPHNDKIDINKFLHTLKISSKINIPTIDGCAGISKGDIIKFNVFITNDKPICGENGIQIVLNFVYASLNRITRDSMIGISNKALEGMNINDLINVEWEVDEEVDTEKLDKLFSKIYSSVHDIPFKVLSL